MKDLVQYVNPNIGTIGHLLTATAPTVELPHGMIKMSPVFRAGMKDIYTSDKIFGFAAGAAVLMPTNKENCFDYNALGEAFDHDLEEVHPHYYRVQLLDSLTKAEYTVAKHTGLLRFTYKQAHTNHVALYLYPEASYEVQGTRILVKGNYHKTPAFCIYELSQPFAVQEHAVQLPVGEQGETVTGTLLLLSGDFAELEVGFAVSFIDQETAQFSLQKEMTDFETMKQQAFAAWNEKLNTIEVETKNENHKRVFYTAMYRALERMVCYSEHGRYLGYDGKVHKDDGHEFYCNDGIWDTFRGMHPLQLLLEPKVHEDIVHSYLRMYEQIGWLPKFPHREGNVPCMIGNHAASLLADSMVKGVSFDVKQAFEAASKNALEGSVLPWYFGKATELDDFYKENGYLPGLREDEEETVPQVHEFEGRQAVAVTLETSYDDWCISLLAEKTGDLESRDFFAARAQNYRKLFDTRSRFMAPKGMDGSWIEPFDPKRSGGQGGRKYFAENNSWVYTFSVQHDLDGLTELFGSKEELAKRLDDLFVEQYGTSKYDFLRQFPDATGLLGQFTMGNEPAFHIPYLYNYVGQPWKTQKLIHDIIRLWFTNHPLGICGDEDGGAMSSWLVFSAIGFYPVCPGKPQYDIGSPIFDKCTLHLQDGKQFVIHAEGAAQGKKYIHGITINGEEKTIPVLSHFDLIGGGEMRLDMQELPLK